MTEIIIIISVLAGIIVLLKWKYCGRGIQQELHNRQGLNQVNL